MDISGEYLIPADRRTVWQAINDPETLRACIPGCESLTPAEDGAGYDATVTAKVGPVKATFRGGVRLEDINAPESYRIVGEGKGGAAGFAKGGANVRLEEVDPGNTRLTYAADAQVGGKLAQLGSRLIQGTARKYADDFFARLTARIAPQETPDAAATVGMGVASADAGRPREGDAPVPPPAPGDTLAADAGPTAGMGTGPTAADRAAADAAASAPQQPIAASAASHTTASAASHTTASAASHATASPASHTTAAGATAPASKAWLYWAGGAVVIVILILLVVGG